ncbi:hypothetical protein FXV91_09700 [Methanosarcina sp. DH2]|jgi:hypothetical protein|uniref:MEDS domain-containing protein n=1 Tax=Methanosarcina sp. DH2 TaxID=2605639 RepID=UPI001E6495A0|nr:MEDS domain-containing protein [Methanosarcina sp. DH2]MCC4770448.1 hypothetical protein [Methanosarcina sp. DH2]
MFLEILHGGAHFCQFNQRKEDLVKIPVPYFKAGLENNELCMWITSQPLEVKESKEAFRLSVPDFDINLEVLNIIESKQAESKIRRASKDYVQRVRSWRASTAQCWVGCR